MNKLTRYALMVLALAILLLIIAGWLSKHKKGPDLTQMASRIEENLSSNYKDFNRQATDKLILNDLITNTFNSGRYDVITSKPYIFLLYMNGQLLLWNHNRDIPQPALAKALADGTSFLKLDNGYYQIMKVTHKVRYTELVVLGMIPIKSNYRIENRYLHNTFNPAFDLPAYVDMSLTPGPGEQAVKDPLGNVIFYLHADLNKAATVPNTLLLILYSSALILIVIALNLFIMAVANKGHRWAAFLILVAALIGGRFYTLVFSCPQEFYKLQLFDPEYFASSTINRSLGDLCMNILLGFNLVYVFFSVTLFRRRIFRVTYWRNLVVTFIYLFLCGLSFGIGILYNNLLINSNIPFDLNNFMSLSGYSLIGLVCISFVLFGYLLISYKLLHYIRGIGISRIVDIFILIGSLLLYTGCLVLAHAPGIYLYTAAWVLLYLIFLRRQLQRGNSMTSFTSIITIIIFFSLLSSLHLYRGNEQKNIQQRLIQARKLADQRDRVTEYLFSDVQERIFNDPFIRSYFLTPFISTSVIQKRIRTLYFGGYFSKYDIDIYLVNKEGMPLQPVTADFYSLEDPNAELSPPSEFLYFIPKAGGNYLYFGNLPIHYKSKFIGTVILKLSPKNYSKTNLYPELLLEENIKPPDEGYIYSYAIYLHDVLVRKEGIYPYNSQFNLQESKGDYSIVLDNDLEHLVYNGGDEKKIVITTKRDSWLQPTTLFSYLFCFFLAFAFATALLRFMLRLLQREISIADLFSFTFKDKIQYAMIASLIMAFLIIGLITVISFSSQYYEFNVSRLVGKEISIRAAIEYGIQDSTSYLNRNTADNDADDVRNVHNINLAALADVHGMDVNIYDLQGNIVNASQPDIFEKGLIANKMNPDAYKYMIVERQSQYIHNEEIGNLLYLSIYVPLTTREGQLMGYLNLPYFAKEKELRSELSSFLVALVNVYVFVLVLGGFFSYLLSNSITAPFRIISEKLKFIQLGRKNEPIEWKGRDEIGKLVSEYNKMIDELERSAELLARSERESAWREMAKQVAHEIKNPLTPMKLSIQHLQRAIAEGRPDVNELANRVSATLIEQIDNLNHIASEFSNFAKMPAVDNEVFDLTEVVHSVVDLFDEDAKSDINYKGPDEAVWVYADKNQLLRVFNNLVKNATQAIPFDRKGIITVKFEIIKSYVTISVKDNGVGISNELKNKVFVPNFTTKGSGTGLGLAITRQIIETAGGEIWFDSIVNVGTTFYIKLPLYQTGRE